MDAYGLHQAVWGLFADHPDRRRDFLYRVDTDRHRTVVYTLSERAPESQGGWQVETKPFEPALNPGDRLVVRLRANPVVTRRDPKKPSRRVRHDVVMDLKKRLAARPGTNGGPLRQADLIQEAGYEWLQRRLEKAGATAGPEDVACDAYTRHVMRKGGGTTPMELRSIDYSARITVDDPEVFLEAVRNGFGPAKGFGMGLLLMRRP